MFAVGFWMITVAFILTKAYDGDSKSTQLAIATVGLGGIGLVASSLSVLAWTYLP